MNSVIRFDEKLVKRMTFTSEFRQRLKKDLAGSVVLFMGDERSAVSAVYTLLSLVRVDRRYHDAQDVVLGVLSWHGIEAKNYDSFRFSMDMFQVVGFGYLDEELAATMRGDKCLKFRIWLKQALKRRVFEGSTTIIAVPDHDEEALRKFFGKDLIDSYGIVVRVADVVEAEKKRPKKKKSGGDGAKGGKQ